MREVKSQKLIRAALMAAVCLALTRVVTIPAPTGYVNLGDCGVLLAGWMLGPVYGGMAAGIGVMLADILSGYAMYAPGTFVIKFVMAAVARMVYVLLKKRSGFAACAASAVLAEGIMAAGYFLYESTVLGYGLAAVASIPANLVQGAVCAGAGVALMSALIKSKAAWTD